MVPEHSVRVQSHQKSENLKWSVMNLLSGVGARDAVASLNFDLASMKMNQN